MHLVFGIFSILLFKITRENWAIEYLDIDPDKPNNNLDDEIEDYPLIKKRMHELNKKYLVTTQFCSGLQVVNIGVSLEILLHIGQALLQ